MADKCQNLETKNDLLEMEHRLTNALNKKNDQSDEKFDRLITAIERSTNNVIEWIIILHVSTIVILAFILFVCKKIP